MTLVFISCPAMAQVAKLYPVDEGPKDPSFQAFRDKLVEAAKNRDTKFVLSILDPEIMNNFDGQGGAKEFKEQWKPDTPDSELWDVLIKILSMGGSFDAKGDFCAPYVTSQFPHRNFDSFDHLAIIREQVRVREQPGLTSPIIATLSYDIVAIPDRPTKPIKMDGHSWIAIKLSNSKTGFVSEQFTRRSYDYRAFFSKKDGKWRMTVLIVGD
jgi:hypothetical protein